MFKHHQSDVATRLAIYQNDGMAVSEPADMADQKAGWARLDSEDAMPV